MRAVEAAIAKLQFMPNPLARSLARGKSMSFGIVTQSIDSPFYGEALAAIEVTKMSVDYSFSISHSGKKDLSKGVVKLSTVPWSSDKVETA